AMLAEYDKAKDVVGKTHGGSQTIHAGWIDRDVRELQGQRNSRGETAVATMREKARTMSSGDTPRLKSALDQLDTADKQLQNLFDSKDPVFAVRHNEIEDSRKQLRKDAANFWSNFKSDTYERLAWKERKFLEAEAALDAVANDTEYDYEIQI